MNLLPLLAAIDFTQPTPIIVAIVLVVVGFLVLRFVLGAVITLVKIALLVGIGVAVYLGLAALL